MSENFILFLVLGALSLVVCFLFFVALTTIKAQRDMEIARIKADAEARIAEAEETARIPHWLCLLLPDAKQYAWGVEFTLTLNGSKRCLRLSDKLEERVDRLRGSEWKRVKWDDFQSFCEAYYLELQNPVAPTVVVQAVPAPVAVASNGATTQTNQNGGKRFMKFKECETNAAQKVLYTQADVDASVLHNQFKWVNVGPNEYQIEHI